MKANYTYPGAELALFEQAVHWKKYFGSALRPFLQGRVLEVGAGIGGTTVLLNNEAVTEWVLLEPDGPMADNLSQKIASLQLPANCRVQQGVLENIPTTDLFDCIIYIDVLEHIELDAGELLHAAAHLKPAGHIIVLSPAFQFLYSSFDKAIGHYRRYTKKSLRRLTPDSLSIHRIQYMDSAGFFASLMNKLFLKQSYPTQKQVLFWDRWLIRVSRATDPLFLFSFGKSILAVWKKH